MLDFQDFGIDIKKVSCILAKRNYTQTKLLYSWQVDKYYHPASLLKLFVAYLAWHSKSVYSAEIKKAIQESLRVSDNNALSFLVDLITDSSSGICLEASSQEWQDFKQARLMINSLAKSIFASQNINIANKCFSFDYYGRDKQLLEDIGPNQAQPKDVLRIMQLISQEAELKNFMQRSLDNDDDYQCQAFSPAIIMQEFAVTKLWSKAGWNSKVRHDAVSFEHAGETYFWILMTENLCNQDKLIPQISQAVFKRFLR